jgi:hypothetical protein
MVETWRRFNIDDFRIRPSFYDGTQTLRMPPRPAERVPFIRGPIRFSWVALACSTWWVEKGPHRVARMVFR